MNLKLSVKTFRDVGMEAKWGKVSGRPPMFVRNPKANLEHQRTKWWLVTKSIWDAMNKDGVLEGFDNSTLLGDVFSLRV